ncbi:MAG: glycosyltransferase [Fibrobacterota bacterium]|nr:glycosyltransferase [Chitinispirillaceae bacterium]
MNILFIRSHTFLTNEVENALRKRDDLIVTTLSMPLNPDQDAIASALSDIQAILPALVVIINDTGTDKDGIFVKELIKRGCFIVNWFHDYPLYEEIFSGRVLLTDPHIVNLVSEQSFVEILRARGCQTFFMPLATDPSYFPKADDTGFFHDVSFVGNSSSLFIDSIMNESRGNEINRLLPLLALLKKQYYSNPRSNIRQYLLDNKAQWIDKTSLDENETIFLLEWLCGYFYRRDFIVAVSDHFKERFVCFGDGDWEHFIKQSRISAEACYYTTLYRCYASTKVNLNINRIQIRTSFTQRIFDCAACGAFLLTDKRELNSSYFTLDGSDQELVDFTSLKDCIDKTEYFITHEDERMAIAARAQRKVLELHTYDNRIASILAICKDVWRV